MVDRELGGINVLYSYAHVRKWKEFPNTHGLRMLDSGGFSLINKEGEYPYSFDEYIEFANKWKFDYVATMDYPCDARVHVSKIQLTHKERILRTVENTAYLIDKIPNLLPVIQGYTIDEYAECIDLMRDAGVLKDYCAIGSLCLRRSVKDIVNTVNAIHRLIPNVKFHCFGLKLTSVFRMGTYLRSFDSAVWSLPWHKYGKLLKFENGKLKYYKREEEHGQECCYICLKAYIQYVNYRLQKWNGQGDDKDEI